MSIYAPLAAFTLKHLQLWLQRMITRAMPILYATFLKVSAEYFIAKHIYG